MKYFFGDTELDFIQGLLNNDFAAQFPNMKGRRYDGFSMMVGSPIGSPRSYDHAAKRWTSTLLPVQRIIEYKSRPSRHECDGRCLNATGRTMQCECSCGGKNHGRGAILCELLTG